MPRVLLLASGVLLLGAPAAADPLDWSVRSLERDVLGESPLLMPSQPLRRPVAPEESEPAEAPRPRRLGFFADGMAFRVLKDGNGLDLRGGAYLRLLRNLTLRGSYRVFDYDRLEGDTSLEKDYHGPLFGLRLRF